jgi:hypothetical protein
MGTSLNGLTPAATYSGLIKFGDNSAIGASLKSLSDGNGNDTILSISTTALQIGGTTGLHWDDTNKRLGMNTITPTAKIEIIGGSTSGTFSLKIKKTDGTPLFQIRDDGIILIGNSVGSINTVNGSSDLPTIYAYTSIYTGINTKNASARMECDSTTQGFLPPRMTTTQKTNISTPAAGLVVYDTTLGKLCVRTASAWETITSV